MKTSQWTLALAVTVVMVFGITFMMNYTGTTGTTGQLHNVPPDYPKLLFPGTESLPMENSRFGIPTERGHQGQADFWFYNPNDKPVQVGLHKIGCQCSSVEVWTAPDDFLVERAREVAGAFGAVFAEAAPLAVTTVLEALEQPDRAVALEKGRKPQVLKGHDAAETQVDTVSVPPGTIGWVRLKWKNSQLGRQNMNAELWYHHPDTGRQTILTAFVDLFEPLMGPATPSTRLANLTPGNLPYTGDVLVWSCTRRSLDLRAVNASLRGRSATEDPFEVGTPEPVPLSEAHRLRGPGGEEAPLKCLYRVPFTLRSKSADGKVPLDQGEFVRLLRVELNDELVDPLVYRIEGALLDTVRVEGDPKAQTIDLGEFPRDSGTPVRRRVLTTALPDLELVLDTERSAKFVKAELGPPERTLDGGRSWTLKVWIEPRAAAGIFPRDNEVYRDSALYFRSPSGDGRPLRIPVRGNAITR